MQSTDMSHVIDGSPLSNACDHQQGQGTGQMSRASPVPNPHHAERQLALSKTAPAVLTQLLTHALGWGLSLTLEARMLASGPNTTCPEAHPINSQQSSKHSPLLAVRIVHSFTRSFIRAFINSPGEGGNMGGGGQAGREATSDLMQATLCQAV